MVSHREGDGFRHLLEAPLWSLHESGHAVRLRLFLVKRMLTKLKPTEALRIMGRMIDQNRFTILREIRLIERVIASKIRLLEEAETSEQCELRRAQINDLRARKLELTLLEREVAGGWAPLGKAN